LITLVDSWRISGKMGYSRKEMMKWLKYPKMAKTLPRGFGHLRRGLGISDFGLVVRSASAGAV
jgi:hypothetical protein